MTKKIPLAPPTLNILSGLPSPGADEAIETLLKGDGVRLERIVSYGHAAPAGFWYDQHEAEWVVVMSGRAKVKRKIASLVQGTVCCSLRIAGTG
jgi:hypothetical protein